VRRCIRVGALAVAATSAALVAGHSPAQATWTVLSSPGVVKATSASLPAVGRPVGITVLRDVAVVWPALGVSVTGYRVARYDAITGARQQIGAGCAGTVADNKCVENDVPKGLWRYAVQAMQGAHWAGPESPPSNPVLVLWGASADDKEKKGGPNDAAATTGGSITDPSKSTTSEDGSSSPENPQPVPTDAVTTPPDSPSAEPTAGDGSTGSGTQPPQAGDGGSTTPAG
jgi:hypothetical protein